MHVRTYCFLQEELEHCGAQLPSKARLPSSLDAEGKERLLLLQRYLNTLMDVEALRRSEPLLYFLSTDTDPVRRSLWRAAVGSTQFVGLHPAL